MAGNSVDICNLALGRIGVGQRITSLGDTTVEAQECNLRYDQARRMALMDARLPFSLQRQQLLTTDTVKDGWTYCYIVPAGALLEVALWQTGIRNPTPEQLVPFTVEASSTNQARVCLTDLKEPVLLCIADMSYVPGMPAYFVDVLAWGLAAELAIVLPVKTSLEQQCRKRYADAVIHAQAMTMRGQQKDMPPDSQFIRVRG